MGNFAVQHLDPGGEFYYSLGASAPGIWTGGTVASLVNNAPAGRATTYAIDLGATSYVARNFNNYASWIAGFAYYVAALPSSGNLQLAAFLDNGNQQCDLRVASTGALLFTRNGTQLGSNSTNLLSPGAWYYIEVKAVIASGTSGSIEVRVNGVAWITVTGVNTQNTANAYANQVKILGTSSGPHDYLKDVAMLADTGSGPHSSYLGDITVAVNYPNGAGVNSAWAANGAASDWQCVDDAPPGTAPDGDTTYISDATAGDKADFAHQALSLTGSILAVVHASYLRKDDAGSRTVAQICLSNGTQETSPNISLGNTYQYFFDVLETDPHTSAAWALAGYNAATFGIEEVS